MAELAEVSDARATYRNAYRPRDWEVGEIELLIRNKEEHHVSVDPASHSDVIAFAAAADAFDQIAADWPPKPDNLALEERRPQLRRDARNGRNSGIGAGRFLAPASRCECGSVRAGDGQRRGARARWHLTQ
jgi:hypothetical protein